MAERTIYQMLRESVQKFGPRPAMGYRQGDAYRYLTYNEVWERAMALRRGLASLGIHKGDRIALLSENRPEWALSDLAAHALGVITVAIYPTLPTPQVQYLLSDSAARVLILSNAKQLAKALELWPHVRTLEQVVLMDGPAPESVLTFEALSERGRASGLPDSDLDAQVADISPDDVATLIYTSGTTGDPKGAMLTHTNLLHTAYAARQIVELNENDLFLSFLPLSHIIERVGGHYLPLSIGAQIVYSEGVFAIANEIATVKPTVFLCVPRLYESVQEKIMDVAAKFPTWRRRLFDWALRVGRECVQRREQGDRIGPLLSWQRALADRLVLRQLRLKATGGRARFFVSGGAPLNPDTATFFEAFGVRLLEGYGLTECPVITLNRPEKSRLGTVGPPLPGMEVRIAEDGEVLARGPSRMRGYFGKPEATAEAIDAEGWLHTGDIGELTPDGMLKITDRKKDIIVLANGKNVAPQPIEARLKESPYIAEIVLLGDRQNILSAIVVPAFDRLRTWASQQGIPAHDIGELVRRAETRRLIKEEIDRLSGHLADFERVRRFALVEEPFSIESGELTPTLKVKRKVVGQKYAHLIEQMAR